MVVEHAAARSPSRGLLSAPALALQPAALSNRPVNGTDFLFGYLELSMDTLSLAPSMGGFGAAHSGLVQACTCIG